MSDRKLPAELDHPFSAAGCRDPFPAYRWLTGNAPVCFDDVTGFWLVSGYRQCARLLKDPQFSAALGQRQRTHGEQVPASMLSTDQPEHARLRGPGMQLAGPQALAAVAGTLREELEELVEGLPKTGTVAVGPSIGEPVALSALGILLGIPPTERGALQALARAVSVNLDPLAGPAAAYAGRLAGGELTRYLGQYADGCDPASPVGALLADPRLTRAEALSLLSLVVTGGYTPLAEFTGNALALLLESPEAVNWVVAAGEDCGTAVDELLRLTPPIPFTARVTVAEVELGDVSVPRGARLLALLAAANRDPAIFDDPDELDVHRSPNPHLAFGAGPHFCLAGAAVRLALSMLLPRLLSRFPHISIAQPAPDWAPTVFPRRLQDFSVRLG